MSFSTYKKEAMCYKFLHHQNKHQILSSVLNLRLLNQEKLQQCYNMQIRSDHQIFSLFPVGLNKDIQPSCGSEHAA